MVAIPIISGIYADAQSDFRTSYPVNLVPVPKSTGISEGYLRPGYGITKQGNGYGLDRGGAVWNGILYRVSGSKFIKILDDGTVIIIGDIPGTDMASFAYSFDKMAIVADLKMWLFDGTVLTQITDPDLGEPIDVMWIDGYFLFCDSTTLAVTELNDPFAIDPLKYGSSEIDPDPLLAVRKVRNEVYAINRHTIEVFSNVGGSGFPFGRINGAQIGKGAVGTRAVAVFGQNADTLGFVGSGVSDQRDEPVSVYLGANGGANKIATREIELILRNYTDEELAATVVEAMVDLGHEWLLIQLPDRTLVYDHAASVVMQKPVWHVLRSGALALGRYRARSHVWCYGRWNVADPKSANVGYLTLDDGLHWGEHVQWTFSVPIIYGEGRGMILHSMELVGLSGHGNESVITAEYSNDGETWSQPRGLAIGLKRAIRLVWRRQGRFTNWRTYRFRGDSRAHYSPVRIEAILEVLAW